jgi:molybdopterin converting factor subunit 1
MTTTTNPPSSARTFSLPNLLTYGRIVAVPVVVGCMYWQAILGYGLWLRWVAFAIFVIAGITDVLDGYVARIWAQQSTFGRMLDPIADKLLVSSCLLMLAADGTIRGWALWAAIVILCREIPRGRAAFDRRLAARQLERVRMKLVYFAWVRERIGRPEEEIDLPASVRTVSDLVTWLSARGEEYAYAFENAKVIRAAIDKTHVKPDAAVTGAREVAFFPPMTGG